MTSLSRSIASRLPEAKNKTLSQNNPPASSKGIRVVAPEDVDSRLLSKESRVPPYGQRKGWRPREDADFGDGGAYPEVPVAQYPHGIGRQVQQTSNALTLRTNREGKTDHAGAIARRGHGKDRIIHSNYSALIPSRTADMQIERPSAEEAEETRQRTALALEKLVNGAQAAQKPKSINTSRGAPQYVQYTSADQMGNTTAGRSRVLKIVEAQKDPMEPPKHKHKRIPGRAPSPPPPVMHSPPRKLDAETQQAWRIPPSVSNWKNPKGYTIALDKRLASDGRGLQDAAISDRFSQMNDALATADRHLREEVKQRALMQQKIADNEKMQKEDKLRDLAKMARERGQGRSATPEGRDSRSRSRSASSFDSRRSDDSDGHARREREQQRRQRREEEQREIRQSRMGHERRMQQMARDEGRDITEKVALGMAKPTKSAEAMYDSRLFNRSSGFASGFNEDQAYDKPLFADRDAINSIYRPSINTGEDDEAEAGKAMDEIQGSSRFDALGKPGKGRGFAGADKAEQRDGPVQFEREAADPFGIDEMIRETVAGQKSGGGEKRYGMQQSERPSKRARVDDGDD